MYSRFENVKNCLSIVAGRISPLYLYEYARVASLFIANGSTRSHLPHIHPVQASKHNMPRGPRIEEVFIDLIDHRMHSRRTSSKKSKQTFCPMHAKSALDWMIYPPAHFIHAHQNQNEQYNIPHESKTFRSRRVEITRGLKLASRLCRCFNISVMHSSALRLL